MYISNSVFPIALLVIGVAVLTGIGHGLDIGKKNADYSWREAAARLVYEHNDRRPMQKIDPVSLTPRQLTNITNLCYIWDWRERTKCR